MPLPPDSTLARPASSARARTLLRAGRSSACAAIGIAVMLLGGVHPAAAALPAAAGSEASTTPATGRAAGSATMAGTVKDAHARIVPGASFVLRKGETTITELVTDAQGRFSIPGLNAGTYTVQITPPAGIAYGPLTQTITLSTDGEQRTSLEFFLPKAVATPPGDAPATPTPSTDPAAYPVMTIGRVTPLLAPKLAPKRKTVKVARSGQLKLPVTCAARARCAASVSILAPSQKRSGKRGKASKLVVLGSGKIDVKTTKSTFEPRLNLAGRKRLKAAGKLKVTFRVTPKNVNAAITDVRLSLSAK